LVVGIKDEHDNRFRDFPKLLFKAETGVFCGEEQASWGRRKEAPGVCYTAQRSGINQYLE
jgi:hypothetical protein